MIKIHSVVENILYSEEEALIAISQGYMNLSSYAQRIHSSVEEGCMKQVKLTSIVTSLSRIQQEMEHKHPLIENILINNINTKSPLSEIVFSKNSNILSKLSALYNKIGASADDFITTTLSTSDVTVICSQRLRGVVIDHFAQEPLIIHNKLALIGLSVDPRYYPLPNITYSLIRKIARHRIPLAETISTYSEIIFVFEDIYLPEIVKIFSEQN